MTHTRQNDKYALIGKMENGDKVYLQKAEYQCDWYYGFGYIAIYQPNKQEQHTHTHWNSFFTGSSHVTPDDIKNKLETVHIDENKLWEICDLMQTFYTLKEASGVYEREGSSHLTGETRGLLENNGTKRKLDLDTAKIIQEVQKIVGFEKHGQIKYLPLTYKEGLNQ